MPEERKILREGNPECEHLRKEKSDEWKEAGIVRASINECRKCGRRELLGGVIYYEGGGVYEVLPDGSIGGALCAAGW